ncbi:MAG: hypothetical protein O8C63_13205 [Candidatus Methanoperedens sp.]|nr:hypothetical protein [Candidatus Methanoperedens sp.]
MVESKILKYLWENNVPFITHLIDGIIKIFATLGALKLIIFATNLLFTKEPPIILSMELAAHIGVLIIFIIYISSDVINLYKEKFK